MMKTRPLTSFLDSDPSRLALVPATIVGVQHSLQPSQRPMLRGACRSFASSLLASTARPVSQSPIQQAGRNELLAQQQRAISTTWPRCAGGRGKPSRDSVLDLFLGPSTDAPGAASPDASAGKGQAQSAQGQSPTSLVAAADSTPPKSKPGLFASFLRRGPTRSAGPSTAAASRRSGGSVDLEEERRARDRNLETAKALERTLRSSRGTAVSGGAAGSGLDVRCTTLDARGKVSSMVAHVPKDELCRRYGIQPRDLRKLDSAVPTSVPTILSRRNCIILTMLHLRVVITAQEVTIFDSVGSEDRCGCSRLRPAPECSC